MYTSSSLFRVFQGITIKNWANACFTPQQTVKPGDLKNFIDRLINVHIHNTYYLVIIVVLLRLAQILALESFASPVSASTSTMCAIYFTLLLFKLLFF